MKFSFEFFPPKNNLLEKKLYNTILKLNILNPYLFSVTCSSSSNSEELTLSTAKLIQKKTNITTAAHLTCINFDTYELKKIALNYWENGIKSIVALRGDNIIKTNNSSNMHASDLVTLLKNVADFDISVAAYPEVHPEAHSPFSDLINLKKKIDNGASRAITQFFFNVDSYLKFRDRCIAIGITVDIIPGILPILSFKQLKKFLSMTNICIPKKIYTIFEQTQNDHNVQKIIGSSIAIDLVEKLYSEGVKIFHFYTLNNADTMCAIYHCLNH
ncbi:5,10-methylenetetrahydrofolate reductase [Buchnera aphidicola (Nipponaphis monzeni)]|uniref:Methylenetetrahydrofolate reductase n=1 Tax=Buchnera aphidicola (Nipponaphis monzeni) TaxID=2495405 RepID=A0A455T9Q1_9GAMM|nr:methylenetetrahydrofolate reductase [NAD(P)H] [Buchnera aphidicola]BBI01054.1 5,10-methylenetetrahydrofolate reductase [Buchnera aphidicola (Nipponaphis monzeni)]